MTDHMFKHRGRRHCFSVTVAVANEPSNTSNLSLGKSIRQFMVHVSMFPCVQPKARTSSEESMAGEDDRARKPCSLYAPTPLFRTSSGTHVRPKPHPRSSRHSGELPHLCIAMAGGQSNGCRNYMPKFTI